MKKYIYLCSRVGLDAREMNNEVATALRSAGYDVYVPHEQKFNNTVGSNDKEIYDQDMAAMRSADAVVIVGRVGVDCGIEIGWFMSQEKPAFWYQPPAGRHPMAHPILSTKTYNNVYALVSAVDREVAGKL